MSYICGQHKTGGPPSTCLNVSGINCLIFVIWGDSKGPKKEGQGQQLFIIVCNTPHETLFVRHQNVNKRTVCVCVLAAHSQIVSRITF